MYASPSRTTAVSRAERRAWALERVLEAARLIARDRNDPALAAALVSRVQEHDALVAAQAADALGLAAEQRREHQREAVAASHRPNARRDTKNRGRRGGYVCGDCGTTFNFGTDPEQDQLYGAVHTANADACASAFVAHLRERHPHRIGDSQP